MRRTPMPARRAPLRAIQAPSKQRRPRNTGPTAKVRALVYERDGHRCVCCGSNHDITIGHRRNRGMGGSKDPATNRPSALVTQCWSCNSSSEADPTMQERALDKGWKCSQGTDPRLVRCWVLGAGPVFLLDSGGYTYSPDIARAAAVRDDAKAAS